MKNNAGAAGSIKWLVFVLEKMTQIIINTAAPLLVMWDKASHHITSSSGLLCKIITLNTSSKLQVPQIYRSTVLE